MGDAGQDTDTRPLDVRVAEDVMGLSPEHIGDEWDDPDRPVYGYTQFPKRSYPDTLDRRRESWYLGETLYWPVRRYFTDKAAAHMVLDRLNELGFEVVVSLSPGSKYVFVYKGGRYISYVEGPFAQAVCEAALEAVGR